MMAITHRAKLGVALLALAVFALPVAITLTLKDQGETGIEAEVHIQSALTELHIYIYRTGWSGGRSAAVCPFRRSAPCLPSRVSVPKLS